MDWKKLQKAEIFSDLNKEQIEAVIAISTVKDYVADDTVFEEGDEGKEIFVLIKGKVVIEMQMKLKSEKALVHTVAPDQVFGEFALMDGAPRSASALAVKDSQLLIIPIPAFTALMQKQAEIGFAVMRNFNRILCTRIRKTNRELKASLLWD